MGVRGYICSHNIISSTMPSLAPSTVVSQIIFCLFNKYWLSTQWTDSSDCYTVWERKAGAPKRIVVELLARGEFGATWFKEANEWHMEVLRQFLSLRQRKALGRSHFNSHLLPRACGSQDYRLTDTVSTFWGTSKWSRGVVMSSGKFSWDFLFHLANMHLDVALHVVALPCQDQQEECHPLRNGSATGQNV